MEHTTTTPITKDAFKEHAGHVKHGGDGGGGGTHWARRELITNPLLFGR